MCNLKVKVKRFSPENRVSKSKKQHLDNPNPNKKRQVVAFIFTMIIVC